MFPEMPLDNRTVDNWQPSRHFGPSQASQTSPDV